MSPDAPALAIKEPHQLVPPLSHLQFPALPSPLLELSTHPSALSTMDEVLCWTSADPRTSILFGATGSVQFRFTTVYTSTPLLYSLTLRSHAGYGPR